MTTTLSLLDINSAINDRNRELMEVLRIVSVVTQEDYKTEDLVIRVCRRPSLESGWDFIYESAPYSAPAVEPPYKRALQRVAQCAQDYRTAQDYHFETSSSSSTLAHVIDAKQSLDDALDHLAQFTKEATRAN